MATDKAESLFRLKDAQMAAAHPDELVWLSASAGTGKTQVLTARVLRLLMRRDADGRPLVHPENILCLTFTKAGAAEMAERIQRRLARWVQAKSTEVWGDLQAIGERPDEAAVAYARTLFARVIDAPGGGIRIQTIHSFCQSLLASFPLEAGLTPGFRALEEREQATLQRDALARMLDEAESDGRSHVISAVQELALQMGEERATAFLYRCGHSLAALDRLPAVLQPALRHYFELPLADPEDWLRVQLEAGAVDETALCAIIAACHEWGTKTGCGYAQIAENWLAADLEHRVATLADVRKALCNQQGEVFAVYGKQLQSVGHFAHRLGETIGRLLDVPAQMATSDYLASALTAGRDYARVYAEMKRARGAVDVDDLIGRTVGLLLEGRLADWIRFKLDRTLDHILVDEAQDTNIDQWTIVAALTAEYFAGSGARDDTVRTLFTVGDYKQAIFGFQGTSPLAFKAARERFSDRAAEADRYFARIALNDNFRSAPPILTFVDAVFDTLGPEEMGPVDLPVLHSSARLEQPGEVVLWDPVTAAISDDQMPTSDDGDLGDERWLGEPERLLAARLAGQISTWLADGIDGEVVRAGDIMILVRKRGDLARLLVARLHEEGVPVAGVDRLRLNAPLAVQDLLAAVRFALQPEDDLTLASLLVSPLIGWSQDELMHRAWRPPHLPLWRHLQRAEKDDGLDLGSLRAILRMADMATPYRFLEEILSGPLQGRAKLLLRLGNEARDPIEELLNAALQFEQGNSASLQGFQRWFDQGDVDVKREAAGPLDEVRVLTVHGSKGLQAPIVILADATVNPDTSPASGASLDLEGGRIPIPLMSQKRAFGAIAEAMAAQKALDREEHWRLLYVALTRAENRLFIGGALGSRAKGVPSPNSWYAKAAETMASHETDWNSVRQPDVRWGGLRRFAPPVPGRKPRRPTVSTTALDRQLPFDLAPAWTRTAAPAEARPPRPLAPSSLGEDSQSEMPLRAGETALQRGRLLHALFERLPAVVAEERVAAGSRWLAAQAPQWSETDRSQLLDEAMAILGDFRHAALFSADALPEAPIAAVLENGLVVAGTVDRLVIGADVVRFVDFKTGRRVPTDAADVAMSYRRQMGAYAAALAKIFPDKRIEAALLYTAGPRLIDLPSDLLVVPEPNP